jgi:hypothetical protein
VAKIGRYKAREVFKVYKDSYCIIRTRKENIVGCYSITTFNYQKIMHNQFATYSYICDKFEIMENVGGMIIAKTYQKMRYSNVEIVNTIRVNNVTDIEILTEHEL